MALKDARTADALIAELKGILRVLDLAGQQALLADQVFERAFTDEWGDQNTAYTEVQDIFSRATILLEQADAQLDLFFPVISFTLQAATTKLIRGFTITNPGNDRIVAYDERSLTISNVWNGFQAADVVKIENSESGVNGYYTVNSVAAGYIDFTSNGTLVANAADTTITITLYQRDYT